MTRFGILGPLQITRDGEPLHRGGPKLRTLLAALLVHAGETVSGDQLTEVLWPGRPPDNATNALQSQISRLRTLLDPEGTETPERIVRAGPGYRLRVEPDELDALAFAGHSRDSQAALAAGNHRAVIHHADLALACWRGRALEEFLDHDFARFAAEQLEEQRLDVVEHRIEAKLALGRHRGVTAELRDLVGRYPLRESLWAHLILALYRSGRQSEALDAYREVRKLLADELGLLPCAELTRLENLVLQQSPELDPPETSPADDDRPSVSTSTPGDDLPVDDGADTSRGRIVTFLFTDTGHDGTPWARDAVAVEAHVRLTEEHVRAAIEAAGGTVFGQPGSGFCAAFDHPADAVAAAVEAQCRLQARSAETGGDAHDPVLPVRMAVHTGEAELLDHYYIGSTINRVARMRDAAHDGQVLVSAATHELLRDRPPDDVELVDVGRWSFDDVSRAERVYELRHPHLTSGFPPLRSGKRHTGRLPRHSTSFLGREQETRRVQEALDTAQLVTLTGEGGVGKTRLALEIARRATPTAYPDGIWFCDLSTMDEGSELVHHVASALRPDTPSFNRDQLLELLRGARLLLVLDNCERFRHPVAELIGDILTSDAPASILATSRAPLRVRGERVVKLDPLTLPRKDAAHPAESPAVQLLIDRAGAAGAPVAEGDPALASIVRSLDGLPLAIELAAPRLATLSAGDLAARLGRPTELLTGPADLPARQRTLWDAVDGSFQLLGEQARLLFATLSTFRGGWTLTTAEAVAEAAGLPLDVVAPLTADLVDQSMIRVSLVPEGTARYGMLDTMRSYAEEHLVATGCQDAVAEAHAVHFIELAEVAADYRRGPLEPAWIDALADEFPNLRAAYRRSLAAGHPDRALRLVTALADDILMREWLEVGRWAEELAELPELKSHPLQPTALALAGNVAMVESRLDDARRLSEQALAAAEPDAPGPWIAHNTLALLAAAGDPDHSLRDHLDAMYAATRDGGDPLPASVADYDLVLIASLTGDGSSARPAADELLGRAVAHRNPSLLAMAQLCQGRASGDQPAVAVRYFRDALTTASSSHNTLLIQQSLRAIEGLEGRDAGDPASALAALRTIVRRFEESGNVGEQMHTLTAMLEPLAAARAFDAVATICGALAHTPWRHTATVELAERRAADHLAAEQLRASRQTGGMMTPAAVVAFASARVQALYDEMAVADERPADEEDSDA